MLVTPQQKHIIPWREIPMSGYRHIELLREGRVFVVRLLDHRSPCEEAVAELVAEWNSVADRADCRVLSVDCSNVPIMSSEMVSKLISLQRRLKQKDAKLVLCRLHSQTRAVFRWTRLDQIFEIREDERPEAAAFANVGCEETSSAPSRLHADC
jgi:anti-anti-sigma factor